MKTVRILRWTLLNTVVRRIMVFLVFLIILRYVDKGTVGLFGTLTGLFALLSLGAVLSLEYLLVVDESRRGVHSLALFQASLIMGFLLSAGLFFLAGPIGSLYKNPHMTPALKAFAWIVLIHAFRRALKFHMNRDLNLMHIATFETVNVVFYSVVLLLLLPDYPLWPVLLAGFFAGDVIETFLCVIANRRSLGEALKRMKRMGCVWSGVFRRNRGYCGGTLVTHLLAQLTDTAPILILGLWADPGDIGLFYMATQLVMAPVTMLTGSLEQVFFPVMARKSREEISLGLNRYLSAVVVIAFPLLLGYLFVVNRVLPLVFPAGWAGIVPLLWLVGLRAGAVLLCNPMGFIPVALKRPVPEFTWRVVSTSVICLSMLTYGSAIERGMVGFPWAIGLFASLSVVSYLVFLIIIISMVGLASGPVFMRLVKEGAGLPLLCGIAWLLTFLDLALGLIAGSIVLCCYYWLTNRISHGKVMKEFRLMLQ